MFNRKVLAPLFALVAFLLLSASGAYSAPNAGGNDSGPLESATGAWFVELNGSADAFRAKAKASGLSFNERFEFKRLWKGLSVSTDADTASALGSLDGVVSVHPVGVVTNGPMQKIDEPQLVHAIAIQRIIGKAHGFIGKATASGSWTLCVNTCPGLHA